MRGFPGDVLRSRSRCNSTYHEEHEGLEGRSPLLWVQSAKLFLFFVSFVVQKLVSTMKNMKGLKVNPAALDTKPELSTSSTS